MSLPRLQGQFNKILEASGNVCLGQVQEWVVQSSELVDKIQQAPALWVYSVVDAGHNKAGTESGALHHQRWEGSPQGTLCVT